MVGRFYTTFYGDPIFRISCLITPSKSRNEFFCMHLARKKRGKCGELRHIRECGFLPLRRKCTAKPDGSLMIKVIEPNSGNVELLVTGVSATALKSSHAIANLIGELKSDMVARQLSYAQQVWTNLSVSQASVGIAS